LLKTNCVKVISFSAVAECCIAIIKEYSKFSFFYAYLYVNTRTLLFPKAKSVEATDSIEGRIEDLVLIRLKSIIINFKIML
jgi:hypothetical protein